MPACYAPQCPSGQGTRVNTMAVENLNGLLLGLRERVDRAQVRL